MTEGRKSAAADPPFALARSPRVLVIAFACGPHGSEPGVSWAFAVAASQVAEVHVLTTSLYRKELEIAVAELGTTAPLVEYVDPPRFQSARRRFHVLEHLFHMLSYEAWKGAARKRAAELHADAPYDVVHHLSYGNIWLKPVGAELGLPFVVGPLSGGPRVHLSLYPALGVPGAIRETARLLFRVSQMLNPRWRRYWSKATVVLAANQETLNRLPAHVRSRTRIRVQSVAPLGLGRWLEETGEAERGPIEPRSVVAAGRLLPWKGFALAVYALAYLPEWHLTIVGSGHDEARIRRLAERCGVADRITRMYWLPQEELWSLITRSQVVLVPSLRDDGPGIVSEALVLGTPVVALDQGLARYLNGRPGMVTVTPESVSATARRLAESIQTAPPISEVESDDLRWDRLSALLSHIYREALDQGAGARVS